MGEIFLTDELNNISYDAISRYFTTLAQFGYKSYSDVDKMLAFFGLVDMLDIFNGYITESDFRSITNAMYCLFGTTCLLRYPEYINDDSIIHESKLNWVLRKSEDDLLRLSEKDEFRVKA